MVDMEDKPAPVAKVKCDCGKIKDILSTSTSYQSYCMCGKVAIGLKCGRKDYSAAEFATNTLRAVLV